MSREDCARNSYIIAESDAYNCACPQCGSRFLNEDYSLQFVEVVPCPPCLKKRMDDPSRLKGVRRLAKAQKARL